MSIYPPGTALILVAVVTEPRDLEIARLLGWYRIPLRHAPKVVSVDYLAFYQTGGFGEEHHWRVETIAPVRGHEMATRAELLRSEPDHPRAHEEYYKMQLGPLQTLPQPILAGNWRRFTFLYTTGELLKNAHSLIDLVVRSEERNLLWRSLRERALKEGTYQADELPDEAVEPALLALLGDVKGLQEEKGGYEVEENW
ncbi:hypothetical protein LARV_01958 [Longilinea arvoryzae]|uniref:Uncharacterized protein n=1 Tax=Longilinea arvoryzae TaxID=360412 RepID=A0A0S7BGC8_9CHLR|nr:hypothetical protein [Longilinea arvoryzae]GAP14192.1 hypothetical protein LARV_01958 [Longilinea arvoryzae]